jgi:hypothetical protein
MPRSLPIEYEGVIYHVLNRGNNESLLRRPSERLGWGSEGILEWLAVSGKAVQDLKFEKVRPAWALGTGEFKKELAQIVTKTL